MSGLVTSARVITAAAAIMVFVFGSFVLNGDPTIKQFGVGLAVAVILDATIVRCLLVPALMVLMGKVNWYMPEMAGPDRSPRQHRGRGVLRGARPRGGARADELTVAEQRLIGGARLRGRATAARPRDRR